MKVLAQSLKIGDVIMPPSREVQLWMRRDLERRNLPESALHLTITNIDQGEPDKRGRWLVIAAAQWIGDGKVRSMRFKARPETPWQVV